MEIPDITNAKTILRKRMRLLLKQSRTDDGRVRAAVRAFLDELAPGTTIAGYAALPGEVDLLGLIDSSHQWVLPRVSGNRLIFHRITDPTKDLRPGAFGIREPETTLPTIPESEIRIFLCPGLAFDPKGGRLGRGRGFYDRTLENARPDSLKVGICRPSQLVDDTFSEVHDIRMDRVISGEI